MQFALMQAMEIGAHELPLHPLEPLGLIFWIALLLGAGIQMLLNRKIACQPARAAWILLLAVCMLICEIACQTITGWELLLPVMLYFYLLAMLLGSLLGVLLCRIRQRKRK